VTRKNLLGCRDQWRGKTFDDVPYACLKGCFASAKVTRVLPPNAPRPASAELLTEIPVRRIPQRFPNPAQ
jgi:hypothetical protein